MRNVDNDSFIPSDVREEVRRKKARYGAKQPGLSDFKGDIFLQSQTQTQTQTQTPSSVNTPLSVSPSEMWANARTENCNAARNDNNDNNGNDNYNDNNAVPHNERERSFDLDRQQKKWIPRARIRTQHSDLKPISFRDLSQSPPRHTHTYTQLHSKLSRERARRSLNLSSQRSISAAKQSKLAFPPLSRSNTHHTRTPTHTRTHTQKRTSASVSIRSRDTTSHTQYNRRKVNNNKLRKKKMELVHSDTEEIGVMLRKSSSYFEDPKFVDSDDDILDAVFSTVRTPNKNNNNNNNNNDNNNNNNNNNNNKKKKNNNNNNNNNNNRNDNSTNKKNNNALSPNDNDDLSSDDALTVLHAKDIKKVDIVDLTIRSSTTHHTNTPTHKHHTSQQSKHTSHSHTSSRKRRRQDSANRRKFRRLRRHKTKPHRKQSTLKEHLSVVTSNTNTNTNESTHSNTTKTLRNSKKRKRDMFSDEHAFNRSPIRGHHNNKNSVTNNNNTNNNNNNNNNHTPRHSPKRICLSPDSDEFDTPPVSDDELILNRSKAIPNHLSMIVCARKFQLLDDNGQVNDHDNMEEKKQLLAFHMPKQPSVWWSSDDDASHYTQEWKDRFGGSECDDYSDNDINNNNNKRMIRTRSSSRRKKRKMSSTNSLNALRRKRAKTSSSLSSFIEVDAAIDEAKVSSSCCSL